MTAGETLQRSRADGSFESETRAMELTWDGLGTEPSDNGDQPGGAQKRCIGFNLPEQLTWVRVVRLNLF